MNIGEFSDQICTMLKKELGEGYQIHVQKVQKNNGVSLQGIVIVCDKTNVSPTIYLEDFFEAYQNGCRIEHLAEQIKKILLEDTPKHSIDMSFFQNFEGVKDRICYRLIDKARNTELLSKIPYVDYADLSICFYYYYQDETLGTGSILIYNTHIDLWKVDVEVLFALAQENTPRLLPWECSPMNTVIQELIDKNKVSMTEEEWENPKRDLLQSVPMLVLSNEQKIHGAACILYPGVLDEISRQYQSDFFVIPCSIHEVILLQDSGLENIGDLKQMIAEVNSTQVEAQEVLSDSLYHFNSGNQNLEIL